MTDKDVVEKVSLLIKKSVGENKNQAKHHYKKVYVTSISGLPALSLMKLLHPYSSKHRQEKINNILKLCPEKPKN